MKWTRNALLINVSASVPSLVLDSTLLQRSSTSLSNFQGTSFSWIYGRFITATVPRDK